jgi:tRNA A-37 threonylcarbamoyl transferase component Bud32
MLCPRQMKQPLLHAWAAGPYRGALVPPFRALDFLTRPESIGASIRDAEVATLTSGRNRNFRVKVTCDGQTVELAVKHFGRQSRVKDLGDSVRGSKAQRSWLTASALRQRGVGTPEPVGFLDRWEGRRLTESYYLTVYEPGLTSFKDALIHLFDREPICTRFMALLQTVADAIRAMHQAGCLHNDLGNQNILLRSVEPGVWTDVRLVDLNRARVKSEPLTLNERARDLSRIYLPSDFRRVFLEMYMAAEPSPRLPQRERFFRKLYSLTADTRRLRHPWRTLRKRRGGTSTPVYPSEKELWVWDDRSGQAISALRREDRVRHYTVARHWGIARPVLKNARSIWREYKALLQTCWQAPVAMSNRIGMTVHPHPTTWDREARLLSGLGTVPVLIRFYAHETPSAWTFSAQTARELHRRGHAISIALVQDRRAVRESARWREFVRAVLSGVADFVEQVEVGHAINRVKWGVWDLSDYQRLVEGVASSAAAWPGLKLMGPAAIDFEYPIAVAALRNLPDSMRFHAMSHHLYVDRRGAPENRQGPFSALEKFALARAIARQAPRCEDRLIVSEVNWPLQGTGVYSPVGSPYESPWPRRNDPSVSEDDYADFMIRYLVTAICSGMVERVFWWRLVARGFGLVDDTDPDQWRERPAYRMLQCFLTLVGESEFVRLESLHQPFAPSHPNPAAETPLGSDIRIVTFRNPVGQEIGLLYAVGSSATIPMPFPCERVLDAFGSPVEWWPGSDPGHAMLRVTGRPIYLCKREPQPSTSNSR